LGLLILQIIQTTNTKNTTTTQTKTEQNSKIALSTLCLYVIGIIFIVLSLWGINKKQKGLYVSIPMKNLLPLVNKIKIG
jgi:hypothetical protein